MKRYILLLAVSLTLAQMTSCKKLLEEQSQTDIIPKDISALNELLLGEGYYNSFLSFSMFLMDDNTTQQSFFFANSYFPMYAWQPEAITNEQKKPYTPSLIWGGHYKAIQICNVVLEYAEKVAGTDADKNDITGQALLLRALYYFNLVNYFGKPYLDQLSDPDKDLGVPLILKAGVSLEGKPRNTVKMVYQQILADLDKGIELLNKSGKTNHIFRINATAGYMLASRVNLYMGNWSDAINAANMVLNVKKQLMDLNNWGAPNQNTKPVIELNNPETIWGYGSPTDFASGEEEVKSYGLSASLIELFEDGDLRNGIYFKAGKSTKRKLIAYYSSKPDVGHTFRTSEALLNRAEAYAQLNILGQTGNMQLALNDLNRLRKNRISTDKYIDLSSSSPADLLEKCYEERRRELFYEENHRWFDLRRQGMPAITHRVFASEVQQLTYKLEDHDPAYVLQIPLEAIQLNPLLIRNPEPSNRPGY